MTVDDFNKIVDRRINEIKMVLVEKAKEYANCDDRLSNFKRIALLRSKSPEEVLMGMAVKHFQSIYDIVDDIESGVDDSKVVIMHDEKIGDAINYLILLEALIKERLS